MPDAQLVEPVIQLEHLFGQSLDTFLVGETIAEGLNVLLCLRKVGRRPPHIARHFAIAALPLLLQLFEDYHLGPGVGSGNCRSQSGMPGAHYHHIHFLVPLSRSSFRICRFRYQSTGHAACSYRCARCSRAFQKCAAIDSFLLVWHDSLLICLKRENADTGRNPAKGQCPAKNCKRINWLDSSTVSYTHLTLPTIY